MLDPDSAIAISGYQITTSKWNAASFHGSWVKGATAGGCGNYRGR